MADRTIDAVIMHNNMISLNNDKIKNNDYKVKSNDYKVVQIEKISNDIVSYFNDGNFSFLTNEANRLNIKCDIDKKFQLVICCNNLIAALNNESARMIEESVRQDFRELQNGLRN
jgi:hypothetical protein